MKNAHYRGTAFLIARGASGLHGTPAERPVFVFECYLDDSGTSGLPVITLAGFMAPLANWEQLEPKLDDIMDRFGVSVFHAKNFHDTKSPFDGWARIKKRSFAEELFSITHGLICGISVTIRKDDIVRAKKNAPKSLGGTSPISACFSILLMQIVTNSQLMPALKDVGISFLIESGNINNAGIERAFHRMEKHKAFEGVLRSISFIAKRSCRAVQLADFFAFYSRRQMRNQDRFSGKLALPACPYIEIMERHGPIIQRGAFGELSRVVSLDELSSLNDLRALT